MTSRKYYRDGKYIGTYEDVWAMWDPLTVAYLQGAIASSEIVEDPEPKKEENMIDVIIEAAVLKKWIIQPSDDEIIIYTGEPAGAPEVVQEFADYYNLEIDQTDQDFLFIRTGISTRHLYLDMDGVIVWLSQVIANEVNKLYNNHPDKYKKILTNPDFERKMINPDYLENLFHKKDIEGLNKLEKLISKSTYKPLMKNKTLWANVPIYPEAISFVNWLKKRFKITILSAPVDQDSIVGKKEWLEKYFPELLEDALFTVEKYEYAGANKILVDDRPKNINLWQENGGIGVLHKNVQDTKEKLIEILQQPLT